MDNKYGGLGEFAKESARKEYVYSRLPDNIRQIGEKSNDIKIYIEDYVMTYIKQLFSRRQEQNIVMFVGKNGKEKASGCKFIYGALAVECNILEGTVSLSADKWNQIYREMHDNFPGAQLLGWGCGINIWNSRADAVVQQVQNKYFAEENRILFVADLAEKEEKIFLNKQGKLIEQSGFVIYYEKNPQMQDYMLRDQENESFEAAYSDDVTVNMRHVIVANEERGRRNTRYAFYGVGFAVVLILVFGANFMIESLSKINSLEKSLGVLQVYVDNQSIAGVATSSAIDDVRQEKSGNSSQNLSENKSGTGAKNDTQAKSDTEKRNDTEAKSDTETKNNTSTRTAKSSNKTSASNDKTTSIESLTQSASASIGYESYIVRKGDTLSQIVWSRYHSFYHLDDVMTRNGISDSDKIYMGQCIKLPEYNNSNR